MVYRRILAVVNEQTASTVMARYAISMATAGKASLVLYAAHDRGSSETALRHCDRHLDHLNAVALEQGIPVTRITEAGGICRLLPKRVLVEGVDLVFYPLMPDEQYGDSFRRHPVHRLLRTVRSDMAIMRAITMARPHPRHILMPLGAAVGDMERRLQFIAALAGSFHAQVTLLHLSGAASPRGMPDQITMFRERLQQHQVTVLERNRTGHVGKGIRVEAITRHHDLIVLGTSERGLVRRLFLGNPAGDVMHRPPCNAILFHPARPLP